VAHGQEKRGTKEGNDNYPTGSGNSSGKRAPLSEKKIRNDDTLLGKTRGGKVTGRRGGQMPMPKTDGIAKGEGFTYTARTPYGF